MHASLQTCSVLLGSMRQRYKTMFIAAMAHDQSVTACDCLVSIVWSTPQMRLLLLEP